VTSQLPIDRGQLRALVREVVRDTVSGMVPATPTTAPPAPPVTPSAGERSGVQPTGPLAAGEKCRTDTVSIAGDQDLQAFVRHLLRLFENPKTRSDLRTGRLSFRMARNGGTAAAATHRIDSGAVTERHLADMTSGGVLVLGRKAVLTPLAREKARALGITVQKERT
jgi:hypothetical protein